MVNCTIKPVIKIQCNKRRREEVYRLIKRESESKVCEGVWKRVHTLIKAVIERKVSKRIWK
jgi:hypothetical protein